MNFYGDRGDCGNYDYQVAFSSGYFLNDQIKSFEAGTHCAQTKMWQNSDYTGSYEYCNSAISSPPYGDCASSISFGVSAIHWYNAP